MKQISKLHFITTSTDLAEQACKGGVDWIQLRLKNVTYEEYKAEALKVQAVCKKYGATLIINDNARLALEIKADGVHMGKEDIIAPEDEAALVAGGYIIGCTTNTLDDVLHFKGKPISYLGLGPFRFTTTKQNLSPILGIEGYEKIVAGMKASNEKLPPIIAIGGIGYKDIQPILATGVHGIAVSGAISNTDNVELEAKVFKRVVDYVPEKEGGWDGSSFEGLTGLFEVIGGILDY
jgi:thiamine-phosphate pyrophosphorylase